MRVMKRDEFLRLPPGTFYAKGKRWHFESLCIKGESWADIPPGDWLYLNPCWVDAPDSEEAFDRLDEMLGRGTSYPGESDMSRDGCFDTEEVFLVFEQADLEALQLHLTAAIQAAS